LLHGIFLDRINDSKHVHVAADHYKLIREIGAASNILLKNTNNQLPFTSNTGGNAIYTYALIGSDAGPSRSDSNACPDHACIDGTLAQGWGSGTTNFPYLVTPLNAITTAASQLGQTVTHTLDDWNLRLAVEAAKTADVAIIFTFANSGEEYISSGEGSVNGNAGDRNNLSVWNNGEKLIEAVAAVNSHTVIVLHVVGPVLMPWAEHPNVTAIILAGLPGQESGNSLADVLFGAVNPSGKLVYTIARNTSDYPAQVVNSSPDPSPKIPYTEGLFIDYRWFDAKNIEPHFEFGFGLSYTTFAYSDLQIRNRSIPKRGSRSRVDPETTLYEVQVSITNSGKVAGSDVVQLYLGFPNGTGEPVQILRGFEKVPLAPKQTLPLIFHLSELELSIWDVVAQDWVFPKGQFTVLVGASSRDIRLKGTFVH